VYAVARSRKRQTTGSSRPFQSILFGAQTMAKGTRITRIGMISGFVAIILWSMTVVLVCSLSEQLDPLTAAAAVHSVSGAMKKQICFPVLTRRLSR